MYFEYLNVLNVSLIVVFLILCICCWITFSGVKNMPGVLRYDEEKFYLDVPTDIRKLFPHLEDNPSVFLSVIIPAYNEENRLPTMLEECLEYLECRTKSNTDFSYELIIVDDGSSDNTTEVALNFARKYSTEKIRVLTLKKNRGKGGAVRLGMLSCRGRYLLFADADGATKFSDIEKLEKEMQVAVTENINSIVIGSRAHLEKQAIASRSLFRTILMYGFHFLVWFFGVRSIRDTQCGFKMFTREAARILFPVLHVERWAFDVELLYIAEKRGMIIKEVAVNWTEIEGSKLVPFWSWLQMGIDLGLIWLKYQTRIWKVDDSKKTT
ncbi:Dolichyl-phosphate beta-glucosyltransferase, partial [Stegodyphus mimosarum]